MPENIIRAASQQDVSTVTGPSSYTSGSSNGFSYRSDLVRVDEASVEVDDGQWEARVEATGSDNNDVQIRVYSQGTAGKEAGDSKDLSSDNFTVVAHKL